MGGGVMNIDLPIIQFKSTTSPSSSSPSLNFPISANTNSQNQSLNTNKQPCTTLSLNTSVVASVPSKFEVESAIVSLQSFMHEISSSSGRIREALLLLQSDPSFKRMVVSLSSDRDLWNAIVNNEMVRKLLGDSCFPGENRRLRSSDDKAELLRSLVGWILDIARAKVIELIEKFQSLIDEVFRQLERGERNQIQDGSEKVDEKITSSLLLSVVILLIVVLARAGRA